MLEGGKTSKLMMTKLQDEEAAEEAPAEGAEGAEAAAGGDAGADVTFPDDYPNSVRHWLLIGALSMMLGAGLVFVFTFVPAKTPPMANVVVFISCCVAMCAYYCMWAGILVDFKTSDVTPRVIFYPKYVDWIITCPLTLAAICLVAQAEAALLVSLVGNAVLMVLCGLVGSSVVAPYKYCFPPPSRSLALALWIE